MTTTQILNQLHTSKLIASCPRCSESFPLSKAILFDGLGKIPNEAEEVRKKYLQELKERTAVLKKRKISADAGAEKKAIEVGLGKIIEKILPTYADFSFNLSDCRPLFEPIDMIVFEGASQNNVSRLTFLEIKSGKSALNRHQRVIRDAVE